MDRERGNVIAMNAGLTEPSDLIKNILICVPKIGVERHEVKAGGETLSAAEMSTHTLKMTASVQYIRKLLGKSSCATNNLLNTGHKTQKNTSDYKTTKNKDGKSHKRNVVQSQDKTTEQCIRKTVVLRRKENETFGFDIQTGSVERSISAEQDLGSCVCWVKENSLAESSGLMTGDVIITVNSVHIAGFTHQQIKDLVQKSSLLMIDIIRGATEKQRQLLNKLHLLQRQFTEKCEELQTLISEEVRLIGGAMEDIQKPCALLPESSATAC